MIAAGTRPGRNPGTRTCWPMLLYALSRLGLSSSKGTSTVSRTRVGLRVSTVLFTYGLLAGGDRGTGCARPAGAAHPDSRGGGFEPADLAPRAYRGATGCTKGA